MHFWFTLNIVPAKLALSTDQNRLQIQHSRAFFDFLIVYEFSAPSLS